MKYFICFIPNILFTVFSTYAQPSGWEVEPSAFSNSMTFVWQADLPDGAVMEENDYIAAFVDGEVRGVTDPILHPSIDEYFFLLLVYSNENSGDTISFQYYDASEGTTYDIIQTYEFELESAQGSFASPLFEDLDPTYIWDGTSWNKGTPPDGADMLIEGSYTIDTQMVAGNIEVAMRGRLTISGSGVLQVNGDMTSSRGQTYIYSGGTLVIYGAAIGDNFRFYRTLMSDGGYSITGSPVENASYTNNDHDFIYEYDAGSFIAPTTSQMVTAKGYFVAHLPSDDGSDFAFSGTPHTGSQSYPLSSADEFHLVANPYGGALDREAFVAANQTTAIDGNIYLWDDGGFNNNDGTRGGGYVTVNAIGLTTGDTGLKGKEAFNGAIGSGQGFFVFSSAIADVSFTTSMINVDEGVNGDESFYRQAQGSDISEIRLELSDGTGSDDLLIAFMEGATDLVDEGLDALKMMNTDISVFTVVDEEVLAIQVLPKLHENRSVNIGFQTNDLSTENLAISMIGDQVFEGYNLYLENLEGTRRVDLSHGVYTIDEQDLTSGRLKLIIESKEVLTASLTSNKGFVYLEGNTLSYVSKGLDNRQATINLFDLNGSVLVNRQENMVDGRLFMQLDGLAREQVYLVTVQYGQTVQYFKFFY